MVYNWNDYNVYGLADNWSLGSWDDIKYSFNVTKHGL